MGGLLILALDLPRHVPVDGSRHPRRLDRARDDRGARRDRFSRRLDEGPPKAQPRAFRPREAPLQFAVTLAAAFLIQHWPQASRLSTILTFPFLKNAHLDLGILFVPFVSVVVVGSSNAVNLTDGLDGLAIGAVGIAAATYAVLTYVAGNSIVAHYLRVPFVSEAGELSVLCGAVVGASLGFLWFNCHPADVFMGDVGSLPLGGAIGIVAVMAKQEILLTIVGGLFVLEAGLRDPPGRFLQAHGEEDLSHGAAPPPFRARGMGGAARDHPFLDPVSAFRDARAFDAETAMKEKRIAVLGSRAERSVARARAARPRDRGFRRRPPAGVDDRRPPGSCGRGAPLFSSRGPIPPFLDGADLLAISPGVPASAPAAFEARSRGIPVLPEVEVAWRILEEEREGKNRYVGVTGTNGKSTVASWTAELLGAPDAPRLSPETSALRSPTSARRAPPATSSSSFPRSSWRRSSGSGSTSPS